MGTNQSSIQRIIPIIVLLLALPIWSCSDDDNPAKPKEDPYCLEATCPRDNVLYNLQSAYNDRNISRYDELLDDDFVFYFSAADVQNGTVSSSYWSRAAEINANKNMFDPNYSNPNQQPVQDIDLALVYTQGDDQWTPSDAPDQVRYPGETWHQKTVTYSLTVQLPGDFQYVGLNKQAAFVLRAATKDSKLVWRIVTWRDDTGSTLRAQAAAVSAETTWGQIKEVFSSE
jgi:hypothetical protein